MDRRESVSKGDWGETLLAKAEGLLPPRMLRDQDEVLPGHSPRVSWKACESHRGQSAAGQVEAPSPILSNLRLGVDYYHWDQ